MRLGFLGALAIVCLMFLHAVCGNFMDPTAMYGVSGDRGGLGSLFSFVIFCKI